MKRTVSILSVLMILALILSACQAACDTGPCGASRASRAGCGTSGPAARHLHADGRHRG